MGTRSCDSHKAGPKGAGHSGGPEPEAWPAGLTAPQAQ